MSNQLEVDPDEDEERCRKAREALAHVDSVVAVGDFEVSLFIPLVSAGSKKGKEQRSGGRRKGVGSQLTLFVAVPVETLRADLVKTGMGVLLVRVRRRDRPMARKHRLPIHSLPPSNPPQSPRRRPFHDYPRPQVYLADLRQSCCAR
jgi:hypothetical protein